MTSSKSITCGSIASARAIATRCCWPPESRSGYSVELVGEADPLEQARGLSLLASSAERPRTFSWAMVTFSSARHVREEVELLEDHPDPLADEVELVARLAGARARPLADVLALEEDLALLGRLEQVDAAQQRALAGAARPDHADDLARATSRSMPRSTWRSPKRLWIPSSFSIGSAIGLVDA